MLERLQLILSRTEAPVGVGSLEDWRAVESRYGLTFPTDYRSFCFSYGIGHIRDESILLDVLNPFSKLFDRRVRELLDSAQLLSEQLDESRYQTYEVYPKSPGLFPWAMDDLGNEFFWLTAGSPDQWKVVILHRGLIEYVATTYGMIEFLMEAFEHRVEPYTQDGFFSDPRGIIYVPHKWGNRPR